MTIGRILSVDKILPIITFVFKREERILPVKPLSRILRHRDPIVGRREMKRPGPKDKDKINRIM